MVVAVCLERVGSCPSGFPNLHASKSTNVSGAIGDMLSDGFVSVLLLVRSNLLILKTVSLMHSLFTRWLGKF